MKPFDYYSKSQTAYPNKKDYITYYVYDKGKVLWSGPTWEKDKTELKEEYPNAVIQEVLDNERYKSHQLQYTDEKHKLHEEFVVCRSNRIVSFEFFCVYEVIIGQKEHLWDAPVPVLQVSFQVKS